MIESLALLMAYGCTVNKRQVAAEQTAQTDSLLLVVGSYASADQEGIKVFRFDPQTGGSAYVSGLKGIENPSFLTLSSDGKRVYAVGENEGDNSTANTLALSADGRLKLLNTQLTHGAAPCNIVLDPAGQYVVTANYNGGNITLFPVEGAERTLGAGQVVNFQGKGPDKVRQTQPHLHCVLFTPDGRYLLANDLGTDRIHVFPVNQTRKEGESLLALSQASDVILKPGVGPRHLCFAPDGKRAYLLTELSGEVVTLSYDGNKLEALQYIQADTVGARGSADIHISPDGRFVYASNRLKNDGIAIFRVNPQDGTLLRAGYQPTGIHPRNFILTPDGKYLLVACRDSNTIQVFRRDAATGLLSDAGRPISMRQPVCLKWVK